MGVMNLFGIGPVGADDVSERYDAGMKACFDGLEMWDCPHVSGGSDRFVMLDWLAGWLQAKQIQNSVKGK